MVNIIVRLYFNFIAYSEELRLYIYRSVKQYCKRIALTKTLKLNLHADKILIKKIAFSDSLKTYRGIG